MTDKNQNKSDQFTTWLDQNVPSTKLSQIYLCYADIESYYFNINILRKPHFENTDLKTAQAVLKKIKEDRLFRLSHQNNIGQMITAAQLYVSFLETCNENHLDEKNKQLAQALDDYLKINNINQNESETTADNENITINISDLLKELLRVETLRNKYGTTPEYLYSELRNIKVPQDNIISLNDIRKILIDAPWAEMRSRRYFYVYIPEPEKLPEEITENAPEKALFDELLQDEKYGLLRSELQKSEISTIEGLKAVNLWTFMNSHNLYTIQQRLAISTELADKLRSLDKQDDVEAETIYEITYNGVVYSGDTPSETFVKFLAVIAQKYPLKLRGLISAINPETFKVVLRKYNYNNDKLRLQNPEVYIDTDLTSAQVRIYINWVISCCEAFPADFTFDEIQHVVENSAPVEDVDCSEENPEIFENGPETDLLNDEIGTSEVEIPDVNYGKENADAITDEEEIAIHVPKSFPSTAPYITQQAEKYLLEQELSGATYDELQHKLMCTMVGTKEAVALSPHIIEMNHKLYHEAAFVDFEEGADAIERILDKLIKKNDGLATSTQLYEFAFNEMSMFLNDNDITEQQAVYDLARHLFEKLEYHGKYYYFSSNIYISLPGVTAKSNLDIIKKYALDKGSTVSFDEMGNYLKGLGLSSGNLRSWMRIDKQPVFLIYRENEYLLADLINIDESFLSGVKKALKHLLDDENEIVIIRSISDCWFNLLPMLPAGLEWTHMLLQELLHFYSKELEARTIIAMDSQNSNTLHAAIVANDSWIQDFRDVVALFLHNEMPERKSFEAEELRKVLVKSGMIYGNQLISNMHNALGGDPRFLWDGDGNNVKVRL